jgi:hypothetical protein
MWVRSVYRGVRFNGEEEIETKEGPCKGKISVINQKKV